MFEVSSLMLSTRNRSAKIADRTPNGVRSQGTQDAGNSQRTAFDVEALKGLSTSRWSFIDYETCLLETINSSVHYR